MRSLTSNMKHLAFNKLILVSFFIILGMLFFSPVFAEEVPEPTPEETPAEEPAVEIVSEESELEEVPGEETEEQEEESEETTETTTDETIEDVEEQEVLEESTENEESSEETSTDETTEENEEEENEEISDEITENVEEKAEEDSDPVDEGSSDSDNNPPPPPAIENILIEQTEIDNAITKILDYFESQQDETGMIMDGTISDWAIISFGSDNKYADDVKLDNGKSLLEYEKEYNLDDLSDLNFCATYPRHVLALLAAGVAKTDDAMLGLKNKMETICYTDNLYGLNGINDDVFALLALLALDVDPTENIITDIVSTTLSWQIDSGAFSWPDWADPTQKTAGDDITGAVLNALSYAKKNGANVDESILTNAKDYLKTTQKTDGGWGYDSSDIMTTSWVLMGINAIGETQTDWFTETGKNPWYPLVNNLLDEGYYESAWVPGTVDWFAMKHVVPALKSTSWPIILDPIVEDFSAGATFTYGGGGSSYVPPVPEEAVTSTPTTTPDIEIEIETPTSTPTTTTLDIEECKDAPRCVSTSTENISTSTSTPADTKIIQHPKTNPPALVIKKLPINEYRLPEIEKPTSTPEEFVGQVLVSGTSTIPTNNTAKGVFGTATAMASGLGLYLGWRFLQTLI